MGERGWEWHSGVRWACVPAAGGAGDGMGSGWMGQGDGGGVVHPRKVVMCCASSGGGGLRPAYWECRSHVLCVLCAPHIVSFVRRASYVMHYAYFVAPPWRCSSAGNGDRSGGCKQRNTDTHFSLTFQAYDRRASHCRFPLLASPR